MARWLKIFATWTVISFTVTTLFFIGLAMLGKLGD